MPQVAYILDDRRRYVQYLSCGPESVPNLPTVTCYAKDAPLSKSMSAGMGLDQRELQRSLRNILHRTHKKRSRGGFCQNGSHNSRGYNDNTKTNVKGARGSGLEARHILETSLWVSEVVLSCENSKRSY